MLASKEVGAQGAQTKRRRRRLRETKRDSRNLLQNFSRRTELKKGSGRRLLNRETKTGRGKTITNHRNKNNCRTYAPAQVLIKEPVPGKNLCSRKKSAERRGRHVIELQKSREGEGGREGAARWSSYHSVKLKANPVFLMGGTQANQTLRGFMRIRSRGVQEEKEENVGEREDKRPWGDRSVRAFVSE